LNIYIDMEEKKKVYIVFVDRYYEDHKFCDVFFTEEAAKNYIANKSASRRFNIETFEETDNGLSKEIY